jgi:4'-phosphopantetheinyl transferase
LQPALEFNLSHAGDMVLVALARGNSVGVDVELVRPLAELDRMIGAYFSAGEQEYLATLGDDARLLEFYRLWTRKEAWLKLCGIGIGSNLKAAEVHVQPQEVSLYDLSLERFAGGYVGALALPTGHDFARLDQYDARWQAHKQSM